MSIQENDWKKDLLSPAAFGEGENAPGNPAETAFSRRFRPLGRQKSVPIEAEVQER